MGLTIGVDSRRMEFQGESIVIGKSPTAQLSLADPRLADQHATLRLVAGRWLIEAQGDGVIRVGDGRPTKVAWLNPGDVIHLTEAGPSLTFAPTTAPVMAATAAAVMPSVQVQMLETPPMTPMVNTPVAVPLPPPMAAPVAKILRKSADVKSPAVEFHPAVWALGGAVLVILGAGITASLLPRGTPTVPANSPAGMTPVPPQSHVNLPAVNTPSSDRPGKTEPVKPANLPHAEATPAQLAAAVHLVLVSAPDRDQTYRLGAACAIGKRRLVTSGAIGQGIQQLREQLPMTTVQGIGKSPAAIITEVLVHPEYERFARVAAAAQTELDDLRAELEESSDENAAEAARPKMVAAQDRLLDALQQQLDVDLAVLEVDRDLPQMLTVANDMASIRPGSPVRVIGFPFPVEEFLVDPAAALTSTIAAGQVQAKVPATGADIRRWLVKFREVKPEDNWSGSPVVNSQGQLIGIYSRPTPPVELREDYIPATHEVTVITRLVEIAGREK